MAKPKYNYHLIIKGRLVGYTLTWEACKNLVERFPGKKRKSPAALAAIYGPLTEVCPRQGIQDIGRGT
jgi:viroplasmin and RNaseH domain-containing protein